MAARQVFLVILALLILAVPVMAGFHGGDLADIDLYFSELSVKLIGIGTLIIILVVWLALKFEKKTKHKHKMALFLGLAIPVVLITLFIAGSTIFVNVISSTKGPVHWHADFEIYRCGEKLDLLDASGLSNRVGTPKFHEHGEDRIHVEGTVIKQQEVDLEAFFRVTGGEMTTQYFTVPTNTGLVTASNGDECNGEESVLQYFVYEIIDPDPTKKTGQVYQQRKLADGPSHILSPFFNVPPGDCIIIEFGPEKEQTEHICETYKIGIDKGDLTGS